MTVLDRLTWSRSLNCVWAWWGFLLVVSFLNIGLWVVLQRHLIGPSSQTLVWLSAGYVFGCAFRAILPRADVQRICLFDTWLSSIVVGRSVATVAELCFALQWTIVMSDLATAAQSPTAAYIAIMIMPLIVVAEGCSWYAILTTNYLFNAIENSLWAVTFAAVALGLFMLVDSFDAPVRFALEAGAVGILVYIAFLVSVDVPMYRSRWRADQASGKRFLGIVAGLKDASTRWIRTHDPLAWTGEMTWMALYFSVAVWSSLALCAFAVARESLPSFLSGIVVP
jgi:hypothetical protein